MDTTVTLSEADARLLTRQIVGRLRALGGFPTRFGVSLKEEGFSFTTELNGRIVTVRTPQGSFTYDAVARELLALSLEPDPWSDRIYKIETPAVAGV